MNGVRAALYLDFDNVFSGLLKLDPKAAATFGREPGAWLERLARTHTIDGPRRWLVLRCYMNPAGKVRNPDDPEGDAFQFAKFRPFYTRAGFEVVDCPALTSRNKNAADIRMALDAMDALGSNTRYDEFVVASADSDLTPLLVRLRADDRRTSIVSPSDAAFAFTAIADRVVDGPAALELLVGGDDMTAAGSSAGAPTEPPTVSADALVARSSGRDLVLGRETHASVDTAPSPRRVDLPDSVSRVCSITDLPRLPKATWPRIYAVLARYANTHSFTLTEATRWSRDELVSAGVDVGRGAVGFVTRGAAYGGAPLFRQPPPSASEVAHAFVSNVLSQALVAQVGLAPAESAEVAEWLGAPEAGAAL